VIGGASFIFFSNDLYAQLSAVDARPQHTLFFKTSMAAARRAQLSDSPIVIDSQAYDSALDQAQEPSGDDTLISRFTKAHCRKCHRCIGEFYNGWLKITGSYFLPALADAYSTHDIRRSGRERDAAVDTELAGW